MDFFQDADLRVRDKGDGAGPVTEADLAVDVFLREHLLNERPRHGWLSEETEDTARRQVTNSQFIVDPIDGTRAFIEGSKDWAISIGLAHERRITAAAVYMPARDRLYAAEAGQGATRDGEPITCTDRNEIDGATVLGAKPNFVPERWKDGPPPIDRHFRSSLAYRLCLVAEGRFDAMITLRPTWEWDIAAGTLIASEAGARVTDRRHRALSFNSEDAMTDGIVAANPTLHAEITARLA